MVSENCAVTCLSARNWASREARDPSLLANCACDAVFLFRYFQFNNIDFVAIKYSCCF